MDNKLEIYFHDLNEETQKEVLHFHGIKGPEEINAESVPLFELIRTDDDLEEI